MFRYIQRMFGSSEREIKKFKPLVEKINTLEDRFRSLSDDELKANTQYFKERLKKGELLDDILPEAFAVVREAARRVIGQRHFDVQMLGGMVLHRGAIAEMKTGEGKTLTSTLPVYLNALTGKGVHIVTVNDYLARRDCNWMGSVYHFLGLSTGCIVHDGGFLYEPNTIDVNEVNIEKENLRPVQRKEAYQADVTYGTNNEFGFDYLRDNMVFRAEERVQRPFFFAIVDEVDSILIDEARTPLIISAPDSESTDLYKKFSSAVRHLSEKADYTIDEKLKTVSITDEGISRAEKILGVADIYHPDNIRYVHHLEQALKAQIIFQRDRDYVVKDGQIVIVDDFTGRLMPGRRYSEGLHQALEAKEGVHVQKESRTLATITFQNFFRMYEKLSGMTGTALTSAEELAKVYKVDVVEIPTNRPMIRKDLPDVIYKTEKGKFAAIAEKIKELKEKGQPVLVGTIAIEKSEYLSLLLQQKGISHEVLNAKNHEREAQIIVQAGRVGAVTIATNMAGRGTDIKLGEGARERGGLFILGTERHEARRIDNQLRGRSGRQGDPGVSQFFVSLEDELMRRFGGDKLKHMMDKLGLPEDQPIQNALISRGIESAQTRIEGFNFDIRKHVLDYDDVMNKQREVIYKKRNEFVDRENNKSVILDMLSEEAEISVSSRCVGESYEWDIHGLVEDMHFIGAEKEDIERNIEKIRDDHSLTDLQKRTSVHERLFEQMKIGYGKKEEGIGKESMRQVEKFIAIRTIDDMWMNHLDEMEYMRQGIGLRGYAQRDPLVEYKKEAFEMFAGLMDVVRRNIVITLFRVEKKVAQPLPDEKISQKPSLVYSGPSEQPAQFASLHQGQNNSQPGKISQSDQEKQKPIVKGKSVGRNDPCPCGSGKKYKKCHGA